MPDADYFSAGGDPGADASGFQQPADTGGVPPTDANASSSSSSVLDLVQKYGGTILDAAKSYYDFQAKRGQQQVDIAGKRAAIDVAASNAESARQVALLNGQASVASARAKASEASAAAASAARGSFVDQLSSGKYNTLIIALTLVGLGFSYVQTLGRHG